MADFFKVTNHKLSTATVCVMCSRGPMLYISRMHELSSSFANKNNNKVKVREEVMDISGMLLASYCAFITIMYRC